MAKRKATGARAPKSETLNVRLPRGLWLIITEAARLAQLTPDQVVASILAVRFVTMPKDHP